MYGAQQYQQAAASTAGPAQLVLMLYDGALLRLESAEAAITAGRIGDAHEPIMRAQAIVDELNVTLDTARGGEVAANLRELYLYCSQRLVDANVAKDARMIAEVRRHLTGLRDSWDLACVRGTAAAAG